MIDCRGRVPRPGGKMMDIRLIFGESVTGRFRDGKPVPYKLRFIALARERPSLPCLKGGAPQGRRDSSPEGRQCDFAEQNHRGVEGAAPYKLQLVGLTPSPVIPSEQRESRDLRTDFT